MVLPIAVVVPFLMNMLLNMAAMEIIVGLMERKVFINCKTTCFSLRLIELSFLIRLNLLTAVCTVLTTICLTIWHRRA